MRSGDEGVSVGGGGGGGVLNLSFERLRGRRGLPKLNKCKQGEGVQISGIL